MYMLKFLCNYLCEMTPYVTFSLRGTDCEKLVVEKRAFNGGFKKK